ncbi:unnamed protein product [Nezara viridula]|uniref:Uncharacterized protein n=1 Tax=Nezara viridula TaxID=85310 RepID=A0A9P0EF96_NEZVI|nr:unnamed protein product [Nezara viridula]
MHRYYEYVIHKNMKMLVPISTTPLYEISDDPKRKEFLDDLFSFMQRRETEGIALSLGSYQNNQLANQRELAKFEKWRQRRRKSQYSVKRATWLGGKNEGLWVEIKIH